MGGQRGRHQQRCHEPQAAGDCQPAAAVSLLSCARTISVDSGADAATGPAMSGSAARLGGRETEVELERIWGSTPRGQRADGDDGDVDTEHRPPIRQKFLVVERDLARNGGLFAVPGREASVYLGLMPSSSKALACSSVGVVRRVKVCSLSPIRSSLRHSVPRSESRSSRL